MWAKSYNVTINKKQVINLIYLLDKKCPNKFFFFKLRKMQIKKEKQINSIKQQLGQKYHRVSHFIKDYIYYCLNIF